MNYSYRTFNVLRTMVNTLRREGVDPKNPPVGLQLAGPFEFKDYSRSTIKLLRWAIGVLNEHGEGILDDVPSPSSPNPVRTYAQRSDKMAQAWVKIREGDPAVYAAFKQRCGQHLTQETPDAA